MAKNYRRIEVNSALESIFAEYQKDLLEEYSIFALESTYESGTYDEEKVKARLAFFAGEGTTYQLVEKRLLSDASGAPFIKQGVAYTKAKYGLSQLELPGSGSNSEDIEAAREGVILEEKELLGSVQDVLSENDVSLPSENNPLAKLLELQGQSLLKLVLPKDKSLSEKNLENSETLPSERTLMTGNMATDNAGGMERLAFAEYLLDHFHSFTSTESLRALAYEQEYLLGGKSSDQDNLEAVIGSLLGIRFGLNYLYIQTDGEKKAEASVLATTLATAVQLPMLAEALTQGILLAWSYGEGIMDVRTLLAGNKVSLLKTKDTWQLQLMSLFTLGTEEDTFAGADNEKGLSYQDYLRLLLTLRKPEVLALRALDLIERNLALNGKSFVKVDQLFCGLKLQAVSSLRRGITYTYTCEYEYL
ncbi:hypothetical protein M2145_001696 [Lachnospiraceae bacterium PF1-21]|uniref:DUF5702 domain-containing protein n=1 Tax=Ohessyouella blattaphilus TaxID=2949333 RepID=UPI003E194D28